MYYKEDTYVGSQTLVTKLGFVPDRWQNTGLSVYGKFLNWNGKIMKLMGSV